MVLLGDTDAIMARSRVLYIGSAVPMETLTGLEAIQQPLRERYPVDNESAIEGIDANISISNSAITLQYLNETDQVIQFPISSLALCAAVRCVLTTNAATGERMSKFVSLNDPVADDNKTRPAIFTAITRRSQGRKVLECHSFICSSPREALNMVKFASIAGQNYKKNASMKSKPSVNGRPISLGDSEIDVQDASIDFGRESFRQSTVLNGDVHNGNMPHNGTIPNGNAMRLIPGQVIPQRVAPGPEFFEPVSKQGYFYSSDMAEVKRFNVAMIAGRGGNKENERVMENGTLPRGSQLNGHPEPTRVMSAPYPEPARVAPAPYPEPARVAPAPYPEPARVAPAPAPIYVRLPRQGPPAPAPQPRPVFIAPPPPPVPRFMYYGPPPPQPMYARPRFFSPPPPRLRPAPFMMPPGPPQPIMAPPIFIRRPRSPSQSGSRSRSHSRNSKSRTPTRDNDQTRRKVPNGDANSSSDESVTLRPITPPTDYDKKRQGKRMSRRDAYEVRYGVEPVHASQRYPDRRSPEPDPGPPLPYDYYVYPPRHGGYTPFSMYNPHGRSRSLPPHQQRQSRSKSPRKKGKKSKKSKKNKHKKPSKPVQEERRNGVPPRSEVSTDSYGGYHSEIPPRQMNGDNPYNFYPPRDFRQNEKQFMNERNFSKSMHEQSRKSLRESKPYPTQQPPTAYELNATAPANLVRRNSLEDVDFDMY